MPPVVRYQERLLVRGRRHPCRAVFALPSRGHRTMPPVVRYQNVILLTTHDLWDAASFISELSCHRDHKLSPLCLETRSYNFKYAVIVSSDFSMALTATTICNLGPLPRDRKSRFRVTFHLTCCGFQLVQLLLYLLHA